MSNIYLCPFFCWEEKGGNKGFGGHLTSHSYAGGGTEVTTEGPGRAVADLGEPPLATYYFEGSSHRADETRKVRDKL